MSSYLSKADPINSVENMSVIAPSEACKGSNTLLESTPLEDEYEGLNWDRVERY
jgi:hypothetical protein